MNSLLCLLALVAMGRPSGDPENPIPSLAGPDSFPEHTVATFTAKDSKRTSAILWRVAGTGTVSRAQSPRGMIQWTAPPGDYTVELLIIDVDRDGTANAVELVRRVTVTPKGGTAPQPKPTTVEDAIGRIQFGSAGCTATVIGPRRPDGRWDVLTAAHCASDNATGTMTLKDGRRVAVRVAIRDPKADVCWLTTVDPIETMPHAKLATALPAKGSPVWHAGYGTDRPGNRETGEYRGESTDNQLEFLLSVSHGDSGGAIVIADTGELIACVCCTTRIGERSRMWGGSAILAAKLRPKVDAIDDWRPMPIPIWPH